MTPVGALRVAWSHKGWIVGTIALSALVGAMAGSVLYNRTRAKAMRLLEVTPGAEADALFSCTSADVLVGAIDACDLATSLLPAQLAEATTVELAGSNLLRLTVHRPSPEEAEHLATAIAQQTARAVRILAKRASETDLATIKQVEKDMRQVEGNHKEFQRQLTQLMTEHPFEVGPHGQVVSTARRQLAETQSGLAKARRDLAEVDAEIAMLRASGTGAGDASGGGTDSNPVVRRLTRRIAELDASIDKLRGDFTDLHPRIAKILAERDALSVELAAVKDAPPTSSHPGRGGAHQQLMEREGRRARGTSRVAQFEKEEARLAEYVKMDAPIIEDRARKLSVHLKGNAKSIETEQRRLEDARLAASANRASRAAITVRDNPPPTQVVRSGASAGTLSGIGAVVGLILGSLLAAFAEALNPIIRTSEDIRRHLDLPVLATVPAATLSGSYMPGKKRAGALGSLAWLLLFLILATLILVLVYPGWRQIRTLLPERFISTSASTGKAEE